MKTEKLAIVMAFLILPIGIAKQGRCLWDCKKKSEKRKKEKGETKKNALRINAVVKRPGHIAITQGRPGRPDFSWPGAISEFAIFFFVLGVLFAFYIIL